MRISTLSRKWNISEQIIKSFLKEQDNNFDMSADEISEKQYESLIMKFGDEFVIDESKGIVCYSIKVNRVTQSYIVRKKDGKFLDVDGNKMFTSIITSRKIQPVMLTLNHYNLQGGYNRGIVSITEEGTFEIVCPFSHEYDFIDGVDHGLARVKKNNKWGIIGYNKKTGKFETVLALEYDNIWNFFDKQRNHIPAERGNIRESISLVELSKSIGISNLSKDDLSSKKEIRAIKVKNFKRYNDEVKWDLSNRITFIVGKNNAGKSTFLDVLRLVAYNLTIPHIDKDGFSYFAFSKNEDTYKCGLSCQESLYDKYHTRGIEDPSIELCVSSGSWDFSYTINSDEKIELLRISNEKQGTELLFGKERFSVVVDGNDYSTQLLSPIQSFQNHSGIHTLWDGYRNRIFSNDSTGLDPFLEKVKRMGFLCEKDGVLSKLDSQKILAALSHIDQAASIVMSVDKIPVFAPSCKDEISIDASDFVSKSIKGFFPYFAKYHDWVCKWLQRLEMAVDFDIKRDKDHYLVELYDKDSYKSNLSEMGSGTIHFIALCFSLLSIIEKYQGNYYVPTVLIEEPEQNLHPVLQSHIVNFLLDVSDLFAETFDEKNPLRPDGLKIIVETHSEYIIRRSQVLAKRFTLRNETIPFRTYYVPTGNCKEGNKPYDMVYLPNGRFEQCFGEGFVDESAMLAMELF